MDPNIDCSLCTLGWPMASGYVFLNFYGPRCNRYWCTYDGTDYNCDRSSNPPAGTESGPYETDTACTLACGATSDPYWCWNGSCVRSATKPGDDATGPFATFGLCRGLCDDTEATREISYWLGTVFLGAYGKLKCYNPGDNAEPNAGTWAADIYAGNYRARVTISPASTTTIDVSVSISVLNEQSVWQGYMSFSTTMTESATTSSGPPWRTRSYQSGYINVAGAYAGGIGDPVELATITVSLTGMREGCGSRDDLEPVCGMWDGTGWFTCFRAHIESATQPGVLAQMGLRNQPAGLLYATCEYLYWDGASWQMTNNTNPSFITDFRVVGVPGEATNDPQQIQLLDDTNTIMAKKIGTGPIYICHYDGATWECVAATIEQAGHPHIHKGIFPTHNVTIYLYSLKFPSASILPEECAPTYETPWWCVDGVCVQTMIEPVGATSGPYATEALCTPVCEETPPEEPYWCWNGVCLQNPTQPDPSATGPYATLALCNASCSEEDAQWWCVDGVCVQSAIPPFGYSLGPFASEAICNASSCGETIENGYWCLYGNCVQSTTQPDPAATGPYATSGECASACPGPAEMVWRCTDAGCGTLARSGAIMGGYTYYLTEAECELACPVQYWCVEQVPGTDACEQWWTGSGPATYTAGPFTTLNDCYNECDTGPGWYCVGGTCGSYPSRPPGATGPRTNSYFECVPICFVFEPVLGTIPKNVEIASQSGGLVQDQPIVAYGGRQAKVNKLVKRITENQMKRFKLPCIHRGERVASGFT